ncbi:MAG: hypothetical protein ACRD0V_18875 [Acidimicrobiales bacterium]
MSTKRDDATSHADKAGWHWPGGGADQRLAQSIGQLAAVLRASEPEAEANRLAKRNALISLRNAKRELDRHWAHNEEAWAWFHAARREEFRLRTPVDQELLAIDLNQEAAEKLKSSWRLKAVEEYRNGKDDRLVERIIRVQRHLDETAENENRKRMSQRRQVFIYLAVLATVFVLICILEFLGRGLLLADGEMDGWWVVSAALYGTLGGAFSSAQRVASARAGVRYPELRWAQLANAFRPLAGGAAALIAFAALQANLLGEAAAQSGPRVAMFSFIAGFSERFIPSLAAQQEPQSASPQAAS